MDETRRRVIRQGELLAIRPDFVQKDDRGAFFWMFAPAVARTERVGTVDVIRVNGPLEYHDEGWGESYESIVRRVDKSMSGQGVVDAWRIEHRWDDDYDADKAPSASVPSAVILRIDSPGGVVAGLDQTVRKLRGMSREAKIPLYAYVDETAYSAAFALCCACEQIVLPRAGMLGSIGVISTMIDVVKADRKAGYRFVVLTSGARKADGHPHVPISDAMIAEEAPRVLQLARQFYGLVKRARGVPVDTIRGWEAARFLGSEARTAGLADAVMGWDEFIGQVAAPVPSESRSGKNGLAQPRSLVSVSSQTRTAMGLDIDALITRTEKAITSEKDPTKIASLGAALDAYKKTKHSIEKHETEEGEDEDEEDEGEEDEKGDETDRGDDPDEDDDPDDEDEDEDEGEDEDDEKKSKAAVHSIVAAAGIPDKTKRVAFRSAVRSALASLGGPGAKAQAVYQAVAKMTGKKNVKSIVASLEGAMAGAKGVKERLAAIEKDSRKAARENMIDRALNARRITKHEAKTLRTKKSAFVEQFLEMRPNAIVNVDAEQMPVPSQSAGVVPADVQKEIDRMVAHAAQGGAKLDPKKVAELHASKLANGAGPGKVL